MTNIRKAYATNGHGSLPASHVAYIVIHETANPGATAQNHHDYWVNNPDYAVHAVCDWKEIINTVPYDRLCWHVGNANGWTSGIEVCHATNKADFQKAWDNALHWTREMMARFNLPASRVVSHDYCSRTWGGSDHTDPIDYFAEFGKTWKDFIAELGLKVDGILGAKTVKAWQKALGAKADGDFGPASTKALQRYLNRHGFKLTVDGVFGPKTKKAAQTHLKRLGYYKGAIDGDFAVKSVKALQKSLNANEWKD